MPNQRATEEYYKRQKKRTNYRQVFSKKAERERRIKTICPNIPNRPGIYVFYRICESEIRRAYCGQAVNLLERCSAHLGEYDHIALSLKKHGFYGKDNPHGWKLQFQECPRHLLDEKEIETIKYFADKGFQMYNVTSGGQGEGKSQIGTFKQPKTYTQGKVEGYRKASKEISNLFDKHLNYSKKSDKPNKNQDKAAEKFEAFLDFWKGDE